MCAQLSELFAQLLHQVVCWLDEVGHGNLKAPGNVLRTAHTGSIALRTRLRLPPLRAEEDAASSNCVPEAIVPHTTVFVGPAVEHEGQGRLHTTSQAVGCGVGDKSLDHATEEPGRFPGCQWCLRVCGLACISRGWVQAGQASVALQGQ